MGIKRAIALSDVRGLTSTLMSSAASLRVRGERRPESSTDCACGPAIEGTTNGVVEPSSSGTWLSRLSTRGSSWLRRSPFPPSLFFG